MLFRECFVCNSNFVSFKIDDKPTATLAKPICNNQCWMQFFNAFCVTHIFLMSLNCILHYLVLSRIPRAGFSFLDIIKGRHFLRAQHFDIADFFTGE